MLNLASLVAVLRLIWQVCNCQTNRILIFSRIRLRAYGATRRAQRIESPLLFIFS